MAQTIDEVFDLKDLSTAEKRRLKRLREYIEESNAAFKRMSPAKKRVQIARDVLAQLRMRRMTAKGVYFSSSILGTPDWDGLPRDTQVQDIFARMPQCDVCGIGSCFVAAVDRVDKLSIGETYSRGGLTGRGNMVTYLGKQGIFTRAHLESIEDAFESYPGFCPDNEAPNARLRRVMWRIIEVEGEIDSETFPKKYADTY